MMLRNSCLALSKQFSKPTISVLSHCIEQVRPNLLLTASAFRRLSITPVKCQQFTSTKSTNAQTDESQWKPSGGSTQPVILSRDIQFPPPNIPPKQAWVESLSTIEENKVGLIDLHPDIFGAFPRIDIIQENITWQVKYRVIDYRCLKTRAEARGGGRKPRPQKKSGPRVGSLRSPLYPKGGSAFGPRGPKSNFYMLNDSLRTHGLCSALSIKLAQNDLYFVDSLEIPSDEQEYMEDLVDARFWGFSLLFVDDTDIMPRNITLAVEEKPSFNLMPLYGLNVYSILKHEKLVLTTAAVEKLEEKLLYQLHRTERQKPYILDR